MPTNVIQTFALSGHIIEDTGNLVRVGPESAAQFLRVRDATVTYQVTTGGPTYTDTVPGLQAAVVYGSTPPVTTVNAGLARYVTFITPAYGGVAPLQVATEGYYTFIAQQGYVIPLDICYLHHWNYYQNTGGVVLPPPGGSFGGSGYVGARDTHSFLGGGTVSGLSYYFGGNNADSTPAWGLFFKAPALPSSDVVLMDFNFGPAGYARAILSATGLVRVQAAVAAFSMSADLDITANTPIPLNQWLWLSAHTGHNYNHPGYVRGALTGNGRLLADQSASVPAPSDTQGTVGYTAELGVGVSLSGTAANFPTSAGWLISKPVFIQAGTANGNNGAVPGVLGLPASDWAASQVTAAWNCRDGIGAQPSLADVSGNNHALLAGPAGLTIYTEGPFP